MPNNLQILAYVKAMQDRILSDVEVDRKRRSMIGGEGSRVPAYYYSYYRDLKNLENYIKGAE